MVIKQTKLHHRNCSSRIEHELLLGMYYISSMGVAIPIDEILFWKYRFCGQLDTCIHVLVCTDMHSVLVSLHAVLTNSLVRMRGGDKITVYTAKC